MATDYYELIIAFILEKLMVSVHIDHFSHSKEYNCKPNSLLLLNFSPFSSSTIKTDLMKV